MLRVRIYKPAKSATQSGRANTHGWVVDPVLYAPRLVEPLMGWTAADDTLTELLGKLRFESKESAVEFATHKGWDWTLEEPHTRHIVPRNYLDNFRYRAPAQPLIEQGGVRETASGENKIPGAAITTVPGAKAGEGNSKK